MESHEPLQPRGTQHTDEKYKKDIKKPLLRDTKHLQSKRVEIYYANNKERKLERFDTNHIEDKRDRKKTARNLPKCLV